MNEARVDGRRVAYHEAGSGDAVVLLHPGFVAGGMAPLLDRPELAGYRLVAPYRRGYGDSDPAAHPVSMADLAADLFGLMDALSIERAHLVGHSIGANVALEAARTDPGRIGSLALLEPLLGFYLSAEAAAVLMSAVGQAMQQFAAGDHEAAVKTWLDGAFGPGWEDVVERSLPGAVHQATRDARATIGIEALALQAWQFGPPDVGGIRTPMLSVVHRDPVWPGFQESHQALVDSGAEGLVVELPSHLLQIMDPDPVARGLARFLSRYPLGAVSTTR
jgi:pimeloyl-ACP methyl ester carboxylesterase